MKAILMNLLLVSSLFIQSHHLQLLAQSNKEKYSDESNVIEDADGVFNDENEISLNAGGPDTSLISAPGDETLSSCCVFLDEIPHFPGGEEARIEWLKKNLNYPKSSKDANVSGKVYCGFIVGIDGGISEVKILRGLDAAINIEVIRVVSSMPRWEWDDTEGRILPVTFMMVINFVLDTSSDEKAVHEKSIKKNQQQKDSLTLAVAQDSIHADTAVSSVCNSSETNDTSHFDYSAVIQLPLPDRSDTNAPAFVETALNSDSLSDLPSLRPSLKLFPNPCTSWLTVDLENRMQEKVMISIADMQGRLVFHDAVILPAHIDVSAFPSSVYVVKVWEGETLSVSGCFVRP
jgi:hypothetical protein